MSRMLVPILLAAVVVGGRTGAQAARLAEAYSAAIEKVNAAHAARPGGKTEKDLAGKLPRSARQAFERLLKAEVTPEVAEALVTAAEAALELDLVADFEKARHRLEKEAPEAAARVGRVLSRPRFLLRGLGGLSPEWLEGFARVAEGVLTAYDEVFGFAEWSKVPGKKLRIRVHLEEKITRPPHFAPQFAYHSEIDFPVDDAREFSSPTPDGKFQFYGLCHELGHVIAMWGHRKLEEDHHAWAHYTGVVIVEHLAETARRAPWMKKLRDVRWRSLEKERKRLEGQAPSLESRDGVLALLIALHDLVGPRFLGAALNDLDRRDQRLRINRVRYYTFKQLREGLERVVKDRRKRQRLAALMP